MKSVSRLTFTVPVIIAVVIVIWLLADAAQQPASTSAPDRTSEATTDDTDFSAAGQQLPSKLLDNAADLNQ
ncbi:MAG: hypothetical protein ACTHYN_03290 [Marinobacter sp.]|uniref:hypothetical protein n=1 Tax=Marinobacter sp. TaxID=50741 RepID=UPI003F961500